MASSVAMTAVAGLVQLRGHTRAPRHQAVPAANDALNDCGVILEDMQEFSNRMTTYRFEIAADEVVPLGRALVEAGFVLEGEDPAEAIAGLPTDEDGFVRATLQLTFPEEDGDRKNPNPDLG